MAKMDVAVDAFAILGVSVFAFVVYVTAGAILEDADMWMRPVIFLRRLLGKEF